MIILLLSTGLDMNNWTYYNSFLGSAVDERVDNPEIFHEARDQDGEGQIVQHRVQHTASLVDPGNIHVTSGEENNF